MAIKYYSIPEKRQTIAVLSNTKWDAYNKIQKTLRDTDFCFAPSKKYMMPDEFKVILNCDERDTYDVEKGKKIAKDKLMKNYRKSLNKRLKMFNASMVALNNIVDNNF